MSVGCLHPAKIRLRRPLARTPRPFAVRATARLYGGANLREMTPLLRGYLLAWLLFCLVAVAVAVRDVRLRLPDVRAFLRVPWKVALFVPAIVFVTLAGRFTDDETWDLVSVGGMSVLTVATSWWSVGTAVRVWRGMDRPRLLRGSSCSQRLRSSPSPRGSSSAPWAGGLRSETRRGPPTAPRRQCGCSEFGMIWAICSRVMLPRSSTA